MQNQENSSRNISKENIEKNLNKLPSVLNQAFVNSNDRSNIKNNNADEMQLRYDKINNQINSLNKNNSMAKNNSIFKNTANSNESTYNT